MLPLFVNRTRKVAELIPELYLHGLEGDFDLARGLWERPPVVGEHGGPVEDKWNDERMASRPDDLAGPCGWMESTSRLVLRRRSRRYWFGGPERRAKVVVSAVPGYRESENWSEVLRSSAGA